MAVREAVHEDLPTELTEEQRLSQLEKNASLNRILLMLVAVALIIAVSVGITALLFNSLNRNPLADYGQQLATLNLEIATLKNQNQLYQLKLEQMENELPQLRSLLENSSAPSFQSVLIQQEASFQQFLTALKTGMHDLSYMVQGSRTWLEQYNEELDKAIRHSSERQQTLQALRVEPASPVPVSP